MADTEESMLRAGLERLMADESGAVTVDWVALTGALVGLGVLVMLNISEGAMDASTKLGDDLSNSGISDITYMVDPSAQTSGSGASAQIAP